jgi:hypothetical protein
MVTAMFFRNLWQKLKARKQSRERLRRPIVRVLEQLEERVVLSGTPNGGDDGLHSGAQSSIAFVGTQSTNLPPVNNLPAVGSPVNERQRWTFTGEQLGRTVDFTWNGVTRTYRYFVDDVQTFLNDLAGPGNIVIFSTGAALFDVEFRGSFAQQDVPALVTSNPTGGSTSTITTIRQGVAPSLVATQETPKALNGFSISDVDAGTAAIQVALSVAHGTLSLSTSVVNGVTAGQLSGNGTGVVTVTAPLAAINATFAAASGLSYLGASGFYGTDSLTIVTNDLGNTGIGGALVDTDTVAIRVSNANALVVNGTSGSDEVVISFPSQSTFQVSANGVSNSYSISQYSDFVFNGLGGRDKLTALPRSTADLATISGAAGSVQASDFVFSFSEIEELVLLGDAADRFVFNDPGVANTVYLLPQYAIVQSAVLTAHAVSFGFYTANATGNDDTLFIYGDSNSQSYVATPTQARMPVGSQLLIGNDFKRVYAYGMGGNDTATYSGSSADETMTALSRSTFVNTASTTQYFDSFKKLTVYGNGGVDIAVMYDSPGIDTFTGSDNSFQFLRSGVFNNIANGYDKVYAFSLFGGFDTATLNGSSGDDRLTSIASYSALVTPTTLQQATGFRTVIVNAGTGNDIATLQDSLGNDTLNAFAGTAEFIYGNGRTARAIGFDTVNVNGTLGGTNRRNLSSPTYQLKFKGTWV